MGRLRSFSDGGARGREREIRENKREKIKKEQRKEGGKEKEKKPSWGSIGRTMTPNNVEANYGERCVRSGHWKEKNILVPGELGRPLRRLVVQERES